MSWQTVRATPAPSRAALRPLRRRMVRRLPPAHTLLLLGSILLLHLLLALLVFDPTPFTGGDNAGYISLARSLLERRAYLELYDPATPPHTQYPPVFPAVIAAALAAGARPWIGLKLIVVGFSLTGVALTFLWLRRRGWPGAAPWVALLVAVSPGVLGLSHWTLSDVPFWAFTMAALLAFERLGPNDHRRFAAALAATTLTYFTRSAGLPLVLAALAWLAWRRHWRQLVIFALVIGPLAALWWLRAHSLGGVDYVHQFLLENPYAPDLGTIGPREFFERLLENDRRYIGQLLPALLLGLEGHLPLAVSGGLVVFAALGWGARLRHPGVTELFLPLYVALLVAWPAVWAGERFLLPVLPLILANAAVGLARVCRRIAPRATRFAGPAAALLLLAGMAPAVRDAAETGQTCMRLYAAGERYPCVSQDWRDYFELAEWSRRALPDGAVVLSRKPRLFYLISGHRGRIFPLTDEPGALFDAVREAGARYVVVDFVDRLSGYYVAPVVLEHPASFCTMRLLGAGTMLFGVLDPPEGEQKSAEGEPGADPDSGLGRCPEEYWRDGRPVDDAGAGGGA